MHQIPSKASFKNCRKSVCLSNLVVDVELLNAFLLVVLVAAFCLMVIGS